MRRSNLARKPRGEVRTKSFPIKGGLNLVDSPMSIPDGMVLAARNYEVLPNNGLRRIQGHERFDGQAKPSEASYWVLDYDGGTGAIAEGDTVTGLTSGHTGIVLLDQIGDVTSGYLVMMACTGVFQDNEELQVSSVTKAFADGIAVERNAPSSTDDTTHIQDAIETQRALIGKVGASDGSGNILGVHEYGGDAYAFRNNTAGTQCLMWKATTAGWVQQALGNRISFTDAGAGVAYVEGETITGTTSGASAVIKRVVLQSGSWGTDAVGYFIVGTVTSGPFQAEATTGDGSGAVPIDGAETANTIAPDGRFEFQNYNFFGSSITRRMYGVSGVDYAFEWDGTVFVPIITANTVDTPSHLAINEYHLQLVFANGSLQNSATGTPYVWAGGGAAEIGLGSDIVGLMKEVGQALIIICKDRVAALYGKNTADSPWDLRNISEESGGIEWSLERLGQTRWLDDLGFTSLAAVQEYGDFNSSTYSHKIEPLIDAKKELITASIICKKKSQIRTYFSDGTGIIATFNKKKLSGFTTVLYTSTDGSALPVMCTANGEDSNDSEIMLFGSSDGYVYELDSGTSFDGYNVVGAITLTYSHMGSPSYNKAFKKVLIEADGAVGALIQYNALYDYSSGNSPTGITFEETMDSGGNYWNEVFWNQFNWSSVDVTLIEGDLDGEGRNIGLQITSTSTYSEPHTIFGITYHYIMRKLVR